MAKAARVFTLCIINSDALNVFLLLQIMSHVNSIVADSDYKIRQAEKNHLWLKEQQMLQFSIFSKTIIILPKAKLFIVLTYIFHKIKFWFFWLIFLSKSTFCSYLHLCYAFWLLRSCLLKLIILEKQVHLKMRNAIFIIAYSIWVIFKPPARIHGCCYYNFFPFGFMIDNPEGRE